MIAHLLIGGLGTAGLLLTVRLGQNRRPSIKWWQWILTLIGFVYLIFVLEVIVSFLEESAVQGAMVMGTILGFGAMVWAFLLARFVFARKPVKEKT
jgi:uncharacterized membrane protein (DUF485 family)